VSDDASPQRRAGPAKRRNWGGRTLAALGAVLAFVGLWQAAAHESARSAPRGAGSGATQYAPPGGGMGGVFPPGSFPRPPDTSTHVS
jgi:hypothetical protein